MNPLEAKFKTSTLRSWKTDQADAHKLACLGPTQTNRQLTYT